MYIYIYYVYKNKGDTRFAWPQTLSFDPPELVRYIHRKSWASRIPSGKHTKNYWKSPFLMGKLTINGRFQ